MYITTFPVIRHRASPTPIGRAPGFLFSGINQLAMKASKLLSVYEFERCMFVLRNITVLRNLLWLFEVLRDWSQTDWKPRFCTNYQHQVQMGHIPFWFLLLLFLLNLHRCLHKQGCVFVFLVLAVSLRGELVMLLNVSDSELARFRQKVVVFHCSYYWLISAVHHLHYFFTSAA